MKPVINVISGGTHCDHGHKTVKAATHCRRLKLREHGLHSDVLLRAMTLDSRGRYVKVSGAMVMA